MLLISLFYFFFTLSPKMSLEIKNERMKVGKGGRGGGYKRSFNRKAKGRFGLNGKDRKERKRERGIN